MDTAVRSLGFKGSKLYIKATNTLSKELRRGIPKLLRLRILTDNSTKEYVFDGQKHILLHERDSNRDYSFFEIGHSGRKYDIWILRELCYFINQEHPTSTNTEFSSSHQLLARLKRVISRYIHLNADFDIMKKSVGEANQTLNTIQAKAARLARREKELLLQGLTNKTFGPVQVYTIHKPELLREISKGTSWCTSRAKTAERYINENQFLYYLLIRSGFKEFLLAPKTTEIKCADNRDLPNDSAEATIAKHWPEYEIYAAKWRKKNIHLNQDPSDPMLIQAAMEIFGITEQTDSFWTPDKLAAYF